MKIKSIAAVGAIGVGMGFASFLGAGTASADQCGEVPIGLTPHNIVCNIQAQGSSFAMSVSPQRNTRYSPLRHAGAGDGEPDGAWPRGPAHDVHK